MSKATVLMSVFNGGKYLAGSIESILSQTYSDFVFLIVNDASTDRSRDIILSYNDPRIHFVENKVNLGLTSSLNKGLNLVTTEYIVRQDSDDISCDTRIEKMVGFMENNTEVAVLGSSFDFIEEKGQYLDTILLETEDSRIRDKLKSNNHFGHEIFKTSVLLEMGGYNENFKYSQDYEICLRISRKYKVANLREPLYKHRIHLGSISIANMKEQQYYMSLAKKLIAAREENSLDKSGEQNFINNYRKLYLSMNKEFNDDSKRNLARLYFYYGTNYLSNKEYKKAMRKYFYAMSLCPFAVREYFHTIMRLVYRIITGKMRSIVNGLMEYKYVPAEHAKNGHPESVVFIMKNMCNSRCVMCGQNYADNNSPAEMSLAGYRVMLSNLDMKKVREITFSGGGEPLLCSELLDIINYTAVNFPRIGLTLYTNGIALTEKYSMDFARHNFSRIIISINASTPGIYRKVMRVNSFERVVDNTRNLVNIRDRVKADTKIQLSFVASKLNIDDLPGLIILGDELGVDRISMQYCRFYSKKYGLNSDEIDEIIEESYSLYFHQDYSDKVVQQAESIAKARRIEFVHEPLFLAKRLPNRRCVWPWTTLMVNPAGEVYPCGGGEIMFYRSIKDHTLYFGNLMKEGIYSFWNNENYWQLRTSCDYRNKNKSIHQCYNCNHTIQWEGTNCRRSHFINIE